MVLLLLARLIRPIGRKRPIFMKKYMMYP